MSDYKFFDPSEVAASGKEHFFKQKYDFPFAEVPVGKSFEVAKNKVPNANTLRVLASRNGKKLNRTFRVVDHKEMGYEVYCVKENGIEQPVTDTPVEAPKFEVPDYVDDPALSNEENMRRSASRFLVEPAQINKPYVDPDDVSGSTWTPPKPNGW